MTPTDGNVSPDVLIENQKEFDSGIVQVDSHRTCIGDVDSQVSEGELYFDNDHGVPEGNIMSLYVHDKTTSVVGEIGNSVETCTPEPCVPSPCQNVEIFSPFSEFPGTYEPITLEPDLAIFPKFVYDEHKIGGLPSQLNPSAWLAELNYENDAWLKSYIKKGVLYGFDIVDDVHSVDPYDRSNYPSVLKGEAHEFIDELILEEIRDGKYILAENRPKCIHSLGVVQKSGGGFRPITDCRQPLGYSINNYMDRTAQEFKYHTVDQVQNMLFPQCYSCTIDIAAAYRTVSINPEHRQVQGIRWVCNSDEVFLLDTRLCFGIKSAPFIFNQLSVFVTRCMMRRGFNCVLNYLDDFLCIGTTFEDCQHVQSVFIHLLHYLGFQVSWKKCSTPSRVTRYLGIDFDSEKMQLHVPPDKLDKLIHEIDYFQEKTRATCRQLQRLCGILSYCSRVIRGGRIFSHRVVSLLKNIGTRKRIHLTPCFKADLLWWRSFCNIFNGSASIVKYNFGEGPTITTDSSLAGYGLYISAGMYSDWQAGWFETDSVPGDTAGLNPDHEHWKNVRKPLVVPRDDNINLLELIPVWLSVVRFAPRFRDCHIVLQTDNTQVISMVNCGKSSNISCMCLIREIFWLCILYNVYLTARYVPGCNNYVADSLSRITSSSFSSVIDSHLLCCSH